MSTTAAVKLSAAEGCGKRAKGRGRLCSAHYEARRMADRPPARPWRGQECLVPGCERPNRALGLCKVHAQRACSASEQPWLSPEIEAQVRARRAAHTYGPPDVQDAEPVRALRAQLIELRAAGVPCDVAWTIAVEIVAPDLDPWSDALAWARDDWRAA